jgi:hypothetical protein
MSDIRKAAEKTLPDDIPWCADAEYHQCGQRDHCARWAWRNTSNDDRESATWSNFATNRSKWHCAAFLPVAREATAA